MKYEPFIYGKDQTEAVTSVEILQDGARLYLADGTELNMDNLFYILYSSNYTGDLLKLDGNLHYQYAQKFTSKTEYSKALGIARSQNWDYYCIYNPVESFLVRSGVTYYKGMKPSDVRVLSFDIETTGLNPDTNKVLMISNTYRQKCLLPFKKGEPEYITQRKLFSIDDYNSEKEMIYAWSNFVVDLDPSVLVGHNLFGFDLPFLQRRAGKIPIGKMQKPARFAGRTSQFRKDGSQSYEYTNVLVPGREVIDTFHLALKYDIGRSYPSYGLKAIIKHEGLEREDRQHFDAARIGDVYHQLDHPDNNYQDIELASQQWEEIKKYAEHDADDSLALFDLMVPAFFYYCQHIPKTMQQIINSATGSQVNSFMVRAYITQGHSIPKGSDTAHYEGGISFGNPGIHKFVGKVDVASLYPSIIRQYQVYDKQKDPQKLFLRMVEYFTDERLKNKQLAKETGDRYYSDLEKAQKIVINSAYGFMGAPGLNFNSPQNAALVTKHGREILQRGIAWAEEKGWSIVNADTDSFSFTTGIQFTSEHFNMWVNELNSEYPEMIYWEPDGLDREDPNPGIYNCIIVVKAKNYILQNTVNKVTIKGSALKATMKEPALKTFISDVINTLLEERNERLGSIYKDYARSIHAIDSDSIHQWASKKTVTKAVLYPKRTNEERIKAAIQSAKKAVSEGDKLHVFFKSATELSLVEAFDGTYCKKKLLGKLFKSAEIFKSILPMEDFPNLTLKRNQEVLNEICDTIYE